MFLAATLSLCLLLPLVQSQAVGRVNEDVWVEGKLGSKVKVFFVLALLGFLCLCALVVSVCGWRANWEAR